MSLSRYTSPYGRQGMGVEFSEEQQASLRALLATPDVPADIAARARIVILRGQGHTRGEIAKRCGVSLPTVDRWVSRFAEHGVAGLSGRPRARAQVPEHVRRRVLHLAAASPPADSGGLGRWSVRTLVEHLQRTEGITVSGNYVATVLRDAGVRLPPAPERRRRREPEPLDIHVELIVVDGPPARALQTRQTEAITAILRWLREHPE